MRGKEIVEQDNDDDTWEIIAAQNAEIARLQARVAELESLWDDEEAKKVMG